MMPAHVRNRTNLLPLETILKNIRTKVLASREGLRRHHEAHALIRPRDALAKPHLDGHLLHEALEDATLRAGHL